MEVVKSQVSSNNDDLDLWFESAYAIASVLCHTTGPRKRIEPTGDVKMLILGRNIFSLSDTCIMSDVLGTTQLFYSLYTPNTQINTL